MARAAALCALAAGAEGGVLVAGDSWGTEGGSAFSGMMQAKHPATKVANIAKGGSTAAEWVLEHQKELKQHVAADTTHVWLTLGGNDAIQGPLPACALEGKSAADCADAAMTRIGGHLETLIKAVHAANPDTRVMGFGYDIMAMGYGVTCPALARGIFPQCIGNATASRLGGAKFNTCWNTQFVKIQALWARLAAQYDYVDTVDMLGTLQAAGGDAAASAGHPDLAKWGPNSLWQSNCIHATRGWPDGGFGKLFAKQWDLYWSTQKL